MTYMDQRTPNLRNVADSLCFGPKASRSLEFPQTMSNTVDLGVRPLLPENASSLVITLPRQVIVESGSEQPLRKA